MATRSELNARLNEWRDQKKDCVNLRDKLIEIEEGVVGQFKYQFNNAENGFGEAYRSDEATEMKKLISEDRKIYNGINKAIGTVKENLTNRINDLEDVIKDAVDILSHPDRYTRTTKTRIGEDQETKEPIYEYHYIEEYMIPTLRSRTFNEISLPDVTGKNSKKKVTGGNSSSTDDDKESEADTGGSGTSKKKTGKKGNTGTGTGGSGTPKKNTGKKGNKGTGTGGSGTPKTGNGNESSPTKTGKGTGNNKKTLPQKLKDIEDLIKKGKEKKALEAVGNLFSNSNNNVNSVVSTVVGLLYGDEETRGNIPAVVEKLYKNKEKLAENVVKVLKKNNIINDENEKTVTKAIKDFLNGANSSSFAAILGSIINPTNTEPQNGSDNEVSNQPQEPKLPKLTENKLKNLVGINGYVAEREIDKYFGKGSYSGLLVKKFVTLISEYNNTIDQIVLENRELEHLLMRKWKREKVVVAIMDLYNQRNDLKQMTLKMADKLFGANTAAYNDIKDYLEKHNLETEDDVLELLNSKFKGLVV